jgi:Ser/Thr protein kinase RdoA (MazF antagonist)
MGLRLDDGTTIVDLTRPPQGMRHRVLFGVEESSGREVAVKIELLAGALGPERLALEWLGANDGPAPRLLASGTVSSASGDALAAEACGAVCLISERVGGEAPRSGAAWERLGQALSRLSLLPWDGSGLTVRDPATFLTLHERRVRDLATALGSDLDQGLPAVPASYPDSPLIVAHGDPGPGNFLDDGVAGTLIDWEDAQVAPLGLDLGRAAFIALLGSGPEGYAAADQTARTRAVIAGFRAQRGDKFPGDEDLAWWLAVAGVQFAHRRLERAGEPGVPPWRDAVAVLESRLGDDAVALLP